MIWLLLACGDPCSPNKNPTVELGLGREAYFPIDDGGEALLVFGPQGGQHIDIAISATGMKMSDTLTSSIEGTLGGRRVAFAEPWLQPRCVATQQQAAGLRLFMEVDPPEIDGQQMDVRMTITDSRGVTATAEKSFLVVDPTDASD